MYFIEVASTSLCNHRFLYRILDYHVQKLLCVESNCFFIKMFPEMLWSIRNAYKFAIFDSQKAKSHE